MRTGGAKAWPAVPWLTTQLSNSWLEDYTEDLKKITVPVLVMHGEADQVVPFASSVPRAVDLLKNGSLKTYPGYPHGMLTTHADVLNPDLLSFIKS